MRLQRIYSFIGLIVACAYLAISALPAHASLDDLNVETGCGTAGTPYYTGVLNPPAGAYNVYVKLGLPGQTAQVTSYVRLNDGSTLCTDIGSTQATGQEWRKIGSFTNTSDDVEAVFQLSSSALAELPSANRPSLMLVSQTNPVCTPTTECATTINGQTAYLQPAGTALEQNALRVVIARPINLTTVAKVQYFADNNLLYETKTLQDFDTTNLPYNAHKLIRVITFQSGQIAVMPATAPESIHDGPINLIRRFINKYHNTLVAIGVMFAVVVAIKLLRMAAAAIRHRHAWRHSHGFIREYTEQALTPVQKFMLDLLYKIKVIYRYLSRAILVVVVAVAGGIAATSFIAQIGTIGGNSMWPVLKNNQKVIINKLPVTIARANNGIYVPQRGDIVAATPNFGTIDTNLGNGSDSLIVKRVIALPGERVVVKDGVITVYNSARPDGFSPDSDSGWASTTQADTSSSHIDVTLSTSEVFLCGDNRPESIDSRFNGPIGTSQITGTVTKLW